MTTSTNDSRPFIPYEHPNAELYIKLAKERVHRLRNIKPAFTKNDQAIKAAVTDNHPLSQQCNNIVAYVADAFAHYAVDEFTHAYYHGLASQQGARTDAMEGASRVLPLLASWLHQSNQNELTTFDGNKHDICDWLTRAFLAGTDPKHAGYWGVLTDYDQRTCETADIALALWLCRTQVWEKYTAVQQEQITTWLRQASNVKVVDNNWHLFPLTVQLVVKELAGIDDVEHWRYERVKQFYNEDGWYRDGAKGNFDYYNAWGFHYSLYWIDQISPSFDRTSIRQGLCTFSDKFRYFFTSQGFPFFGRSACYRLAAAAPLLATVDINQDYQSALTLGQVKRAFRTNLEYFISHGALEKGAPTQGLFQSDARLTDNYSGPASSFWSMRALTIAMFMGERTGLWNAEEEALEIEKEDFNFQIPSIDMTVIGTKETQEVVVIFHSEYTQEQTPISRRLEQQCLAKRIKELLTSRAERPKNNLLRKGVTTYSSKNFHFF